MLARRRTPLTLLWLLAFLWAGAPPVQADPPSLTVDLATLTTTPNQLRRVYGHVGTGAKGVPLAGGFDCDGDGRRDTAFAAMQASPLGRTLAGEVYLVFGDGTVGGSLDTAVMQAGILEIYGAGASEVTGSNLWMDDVTGDGLGDLLIGRQNHSPGGRIGAGALTILVGGAGLKTIAAGLTGIDLAAAPPAGAVMTTILGDAQYHRLGIWVRTGDVTGDGVADIVVGADQTSTMADHHSGAAWVIRGGSHLAANQTIDLADFGLPAFDATALAGHVAKITPPAGSAHFHFGATCQIADLDGNGTAEVLVASALNRSGATIPALGAPTSEAHGSSDFTRDGTLYIAWDDNFTGNPWASGFTFAISSPPGSNSIIDGGTKNRYFSEEIVGGLDYDADGNPDLFVGDIVGDLTPGLTRPNSGAGHVFYDAAQLKGLSFDLDTPPGGLVTTTMLGGSTGDIFADTAAQGDFDGDGYDDLMISSPHADPLGRADAGTMYVFHGQVGPWPATIDMQPGALPPASQIRISEIYGANGTVSGDTGDVLCYSGAAGDIDGNGRVDIITNEMMGNGVGPGTTDVGNLIVVSGALLSQAPVPALAPGGVALFLLLCGIGAGLGLLGRSAGPEASEHRRSLSRSA